MGSAGMQAAQVVPMQMRVGEMIETIERQQVDLANMVDEIKIRLTDFPNTQGSNPEIMPTGYLNRLDAIREHNIEVLTTLERILEVL